MDAIVRLQEKLSIIDNIPLFSSLSLSDKKEIAGVSSIVEYKKGGIVYRQGDSPGSLYCVITGRLRVYVARGAGEEDLEYLKRGKYFGIISILTGEPHSVTVQAVNDSIMLEIPKDDFDKLLRRVPELAIHFGQTLSRRLKRKEIPGKKVFESTIISVFGASNKIGTSGYAINLAVSLKIQTGKRVILLNVSRSADAAPKGLILNSIFFDESLVKEKIIKHDLGIDIINIPYNAKSKAYLAPLLSYLTADYHYVLTDLPAGLDETTFEALKQSDTVHIITASDAQNLGDTATLIEQLKKSFIDIGHKINVITTEYGTAYPLNILDRKNTLKHGIFATLPKIKSSESEVDKNRDPIVVVRPDSEYSKMIRRISRQIGERFIGLALGSGAALGLAHIGVLKVMEREKIPIDIIAGTSMGALIGALWASGRSSDDIAGIVANFRTKIASLRLMDLTWPRIGLIKGREVRRFLASQFGNKTFYDLKMPLKIVACDIERRQEVTLTEGSLADAIMASVAIPGMFEPVKISGRLLVDGGIINPLPTNILAKSGVSKIIAVNALPSPEDIQRSTKKLTNIFDIIVNSVQASEYLLAEMSCQEADIAMHPILPTADWYEFYEEASIIKKGEEEALKYISQLKELASA